jgi:hypothetical protein
MKHKTTNKEQELINLSNYFKEIEELAEKMGVDVDDLVNEHSPGYESSNLSVKKEMLIKAKKRMQTLYDQTESEKSPKPGSRGPYLESDKGLKK